MAKAMVKGKFQPHIL